MRCLCHDIYCAGVNHFSFVSPKSLWKGRNLYQQHGYLLFSSEADGLASMNVGGFAEPYAKRMAEQSDDQVEETVRSQQQERHESDRKFSDLINMAPQEVDWNQVDVENPHLQKKIHDLMVLMARAKSGKTVRVATP